MSGVLRGSCEPSSSVTQPYTSLEEHSAPLARGVIPSGPPSLPDGSSYTRCYCEENIFLLARVFHARDAVRDAWDVFVVFISNHAKSVALWNQKAGENLVVWDYHVVLCLRPKSPGEPSLTGAQSWIYDFDTRLPLPSPCPEYISGTFDLTGGLPSRYHSLFRVVPASVYLDNFASDRSHMIATVQDVAVGEDTTRAEVIGIQYNAPVPLYPPLCGPGARERGIENNLMSAFVDMASQEYGSVLGLDAFTLWCRR